jgi:ketosteroid isomerase-like protein
MRNVDDEIRTIGAVRSAIEAAENAGDADAAADLLTEDAVLMVPDFPIQDGRAASTSFMRDIMSWSRSQFDRHITYTSAEVAVIGDMAFDRGGFAFTARSAASARRAGASPPGAA